MSKRYLEYDDVHFRVTARGLHYLYDACEGESRWFAMRVGTPDRYGCRTVWMTVLYADRLYWRNLYTRAMSMRQ